MRVSLLLNICMKLASRKSWSGPACARCFFSREKSHSTCATEFAIKAEAHTCWNLPFFIELVRADFLAAAQQPVEDLWSHSTCQGKAMSREGQQSWGRGWRRSVMCSWESWGSLVWRKGSGGPYCSLKLPGRSFWWCGSWPLLPGNEQQDKRKRPQVASEEV